AREQRRTHAVSLARSSGDPGAELGARRLGPGADRAPAPRHTVGADLVAVAGRPHRAVPLRQMTIPALLKRIGVFVAGLLLVLGAVAFGPPLFRRDRVRFRWAGGMGRGVLGAPLGVAYGNGRLYVTDAGADRIVVFDTSGAVLESWDGASLGLGRPMHVTRVAGSSVGWVGRRGKGRTPSTRRAASPRAATPCTWPTSTTTASRRSHPPARPGSVGQVGCGRGDCTIRPMWRRTTRSSTWPMRTTAASRCSGRTASTSGAGA